MVKQLVFLLEEPSMAEVLKVLLPKVLPDDVGFKLIIHDGKQDLEKSIPTRLRQWKTPNTYFVIVRDQNSDDCVKLKQRLKHLCQQAGKPDTLVRIVCHELEAWFLGDLAAVEKAFKINGLAKQQPNKKFRNPDRLANASQELGKLIKNYEKRQGARAIAPCLDLSNNRSSSFQVFIKGVQDLAQQRFIVSINARESSFYNDKDCL
ncbi:MAG: hypothetical protein DRR08_12260 [Candidatus Parabeggiatoa sp. nov. 2]|nr:MAG: hypothetical protein B6247_06685 [Beggiatoa sp. 4572_84]RKZ60063.1 MAG: hypothetical protein DRR08_12260 [Gammaproteobacteria bacterium]